MRSVGFDTVKIDDLGDVMGTINGSGKGRSLLLNGHIDHVPTGDMDNPYSGKIMDGTIFGVEGEIVFGRAASDMKGSVAAMVMAGAALNNLGIELSGDLKIAAVVQEEVGGAGTKETIKKQFLGDVVVVGEATNMNIALGHRGSYKIRVIVHGRSCHASAPERGINAIYKAMTLIERINKELVPMFKTDPIFGKTSITVTQMEIKPGAFNVVPEECQFSIDARISPNYSVETLLEDLEALISKIKKEDPEFSADAILVRGNKGFYTDPSENIVVHEAMEAVAEAIGSEPKLTVWIFATDGKYYSWRGIPVIGFGPGEERFAHTHQDHVRVEDYLASIKAYAYLACKICGVDQNPI
jgi:succinyl-diaminopimelate desuccinylase